MEPVAKLESVEIYFQCNIEEQENDYPVFTHTKTETLWKNYGSKAKKKGGGRTTMPCPQLLN